MLMADAFAITMVHLGILLVLPGCWVLYSALFPNALERGHDRLRQMPYRTFFLGLGIGAAIFLLSAGLGSAGIQWLAGILGGTGAMWAIFGIAPMARFVGNRLAAKGDTPWKTHARGGVILLLPCMIPFLGWFFFFPLLLVIGVGAGTVAIFKRRELQNSAPAPAPAKQEEKMEAIA